MQTTKKRQSSYRLTPVADQLIARLATELGLSRVGVLEVAIRLLAEKHNMEPIARGK